MFVNPAVLEAAKFPDTIKVFPILEEALDTKPPNRVARLLTVKVDEADKFPDTCKPAPIEDEAEDWKPARVESPAA